MRRGRRKRVKKTLSKKEVKWFSKEAPNGSCPFCLREDVTSKIGRFGFTRCELCGANWFLFGNHNNTIHIYSGPKLSAMEIFALEAEGIPSWYTETMAMFESKEQERNKK